MPAIHTHRLFALIGLVLLPFLLSLSLSSADAEANPLTSLRAGHPRLLFTAADQQRIEKLAGQDELLARVIHQNRVNALEMLTRSPIRYEIPDGKRLLSQCREGIRRVSSMAMAYRLTGDKRFADGAIREMLVAARFKDWNPSHFLDTAEMTTALAIGYDWLYYVIPEEDRKTIRDAMVRHGLREGMKVYQSRGWWSQRDNNWNQVCNGGMVLGALAIAEHEPQLAEQIISHALRSIPHGVSVYDPSGAYPEGPSYWQYGTTYTCLTISGLRTALGTDFDLSKTPGLEQTGWYRIHTISPTGSYFNYADCGLQSRHAPAVFMLADLYKRPILAWWHRERLDGYLPPPSLQEPKRLDRFFALEIAWYDPRGQQPSPAELKRDALFKSQQDIVTMRSAWGDRDALYVGFKGGDNQTNHGHLDIGSFVLDVNGVRWAHDLGADNYNLPGFFGSQRWTYYRLINHSHNTLVISDQIQNPQAKSQVLAFHSTPDRASAVVEMTGAYKDQVRKAQRGIEMRDRQRVHIRDELMGVDGNVRWTMVTSARISIDGNRALLQQDGKQVEARIVAPQDARFSVLPNKPSTTREKQNEGTRILAIQLAPDADQQLEISVLLFPPGKDDVRFQPTPLAEWPRS